MLTIWTHRKSGGRTDNMKTVSTPLKLSVEDEAGEYYSPRFTCL